MSNTKRFHIAAEVPFDWLTTRHEFSDKATIGYQSVEEQARLATLCLQPSVDCKVTYSTVPIRFVDNEHGGETAIYSMVLRGLEAVSSVLLRIVIAMIRKAGGQVLQAYYYDLDDGNRTYSLLEAEVNG